jgi:phospholipase C
MGDNERPKPLDRRRFLTTMAGGAAAALTAPTLLAACSTTTSSSTASSTSPSSSSGPPGSGGSGGPGTTGKPAPTRGGSMLDGPAAQAPVNHIVILMMENRSFDHWLGWLTQDEQWLEAGRSAYGGDFSIDGNLTQKFTGPKGELATAHMLELLKDGNPYRGCDHPDPGHSWDKGRAQRDKGFVADGSGNDLFALGYFLGDDLPISSRLAKRFTVCDQSFASVLGPTYPNREYFLSGQSGGNKTNALPDLSKGFAWDTIVDRLAKADVTVKSYYTDLPVLGLWGPRMTPYFYKVDEFFADAKAGTLPSVSFVDPGFTTGARTDNHPHGDIRAGEKFVRDVFAAFASSPNWEDGAFILTYDEWGGFFDHVKPPMLPDDHSSADDAENFGQAGFRVPTVIASPYAQKGFVDHRQYDHTSVLRFLEWRFLGAPPEGDGGAADWSLTLRDRKANNIGASLVMEPDKELGIDVSVAIDPASPDCPEPGAQGLAYPLSPAQLATYPGDKHSFELARDAGYFESIGVDTEPSAMAKEWTTV